jgi:hypothetical protein
MNATDLPILDPCHQDWSAMSGTGSKKFCGSCTKHVHDLSTMTENEAKQLLDTEPRPCVRYSCGTDGKLLFRKPTPAPKRRRSKRALLLGAALLVASPALASGVPADDADPGVLEQWVEFVQDWWTGEQPEGCAGPAAVESPIETQKGQVMIAELQVVPEPVPVKHVPVRMGKIALPVEVVQPAPEPQPQVSMGIPILR